MKKILLLSPLLLLLAAGCCSKPDNTLLWRMNHAAVLSAAGDFEQAEEHWDAAQSEFETQWDNERTHILGDAMGVVVPGAKSIYYARPHEGVMLYTYRMLNALHIGDLDGATRHLIAGIEFREEVEKEIEKQVEARKAKGISNASELARETVSDGFESEEKIKGSTDGALGVSNTLLAGVEENRKAHELREDLEGYENYANPLTGLLSHILLRTHGTGLRQSDEAIARRELEVLKAFAPRNSVIRGLDADAKTPFSNTVFVFFETGLAPRQEQETTYIPIPDFGYAWIPSSWGITYPELVANPDYVKKLVVQGASQKRMETELLVNFDAIVQQSFDDAWPGVIARQVAQSIVATALSTAVKAAGYAAVQNNTEEGSLMQTIGELVVWGATAALDYVMLDSDTRSWELLPKEIQVARLDIPKDRRLTLLFPGGAWRETLTLEPGDVMAVWVKSTSPWQAAPVATQFKFK